MIARIYVLLAPYLAGFLLITTLAFVVLSVYRGEVISDLQRDLLVQKDQEIKVVIERNDMVNEVANQYEEGRIDRENTKEITLKQVETIVKEPIYLNTCFDPNGVSVLNGYITATPSTKYSEAVQGTELAQ